MAVSSAIKDYGLNVEAYFMIDAAVPMEAFDPTEAERHWSEMRNPSWEGYMNKLWATDWHRKFDPSDGRRSLTWLNRFGIIPSSHNYYSSSEDVLANGDGTLHVPITRKWVWNIQEMLKGTWTAAFFFPGCSQGGWGFNYAYSDRNCDYANSLEDAELCVKSFFHEFDETGLYGPNGGTLVGADPAFPERWYLRASLLATAIPALSRATGSNRIEPLGDQNTNMESMEGVLWPRDHGAWLHTDVKEVAYGFNWRLFDDIVTRGGLR
jgi:hypothetical protein